jgi:hypothetical protein
MSTPNYSDTTLQPTFVFGNMQDVMTSLLTNLVTETTDPTNSNFCLLNNSSGQVITTPLQLNPVDGDVDDNTTSNANERRVATRRWCKNAYISNVLDPHVQATDYTFSGVHVHSADLRVQNDPTINNSVTRKSYVDTQIATRQPLISGSSTITCGALTSASLVDNGAATFSNTVTFNGNVIANSSNITPVQLSYLKTTTSDIQTQLNGKQPLISGSSALTCGTLTSASFVDNGAATFNSTVAFTGNVIASGSNVTPIQISYLKNTNADIQTQLDAKQPLINGSSPITCGSLTSASLVDNGNATFSGTVTFNGNVIANGSNITPSQLGYVSGITSDLQTQLNSKQNAISGSTNLTVGHLTSASFIDNGAATFSSTVTLTGNVIANGTNITPTQLSYVDATSSIQTQLNSKQATLTNGSVGDSMLSSTFVKTTTDQTVGGVKTFSTAPIMSGANISSATIADASLVSTFVKTSTDQTVGGVKTFSTAPIMSGANIASTSIALTSINGNLCTTDTSQSITNNKVFQSITEKLAAITTNSTNNYTINYSTSGVAYLGTAPTANFTLALHNCLSSSTQTGAYALVYANSGKYYPTTINVYSDAGSTSIACTVVWAGGTPSISSATVSVLTINICKSLSSNYALCALANYY